MTEMTGLSNQAQRMQDALSPVLVIGPEFLAGRRHADDMAHTMVQAVQEYAKGEQARQQASLLPGEHPAPASASREEQELQAALVEVYTCGSGYLADRCDSDCVVRTMTQILGEFGSLTAAR
ncbi:MAG: hypothetical protein ABI053_07470 [Lacisediminihabitans sp.]